MEAIDWWSTYGRKTSQWANIARKVLSWPITSSSSKQNWSVYSYKETHWTGK
jgi:hypothetical protein